MTDVHTLAREIVAREGGFVNDPSDPGGATNHGVTIETMRALGLDLNHDGQVTEADVRALTLDQAVAIFTQEYFIAPKISALPDALQPAVFDMCVNAGKNAVRILQWLLDDHGADIADDGQIGPQTIRLAQAFVNEVGAVTAANLYGAARREYYYRLGDGRPASRKYCQSRDGGKGGWITRAEEFMTPEARFTLEQHKRRCARWH